jgi:histidinol-phosphate aminotransferase
MNNVPALPHINKLQSYVPGKPIETLAREKNLPHIIKLASNENPYGASPAVLENIVKNLTSIHRYPDADQYNLKTTLAEFYNIPTDMLAIGNGSDELLQMIVRAFVSPENNIISPEYSFSSYKICAQAIDARYIESAIDENWCNNLDDLLQKINNKTKLICIANPNNPTGTCLDINIISQFLKAVPHNVLVLLDEAYFEYIKFFNDTHNNQSNALDNSIELVKKYENLIITRTFSKAYGLAGLRVGYSIANPAITATINKIKQPFNVNRIAQVAAITAITDQEYIQKIIQSNNSERTYLYNEFTKLNIQYINSYTNFITIHTTDLNHSLNLYNYLLSQGIIIRPLDNYGLHSNLRVSIGLPEENQELVNHINKYYNSHDQ